MDDLQQVRVLGARLDPDRPVPLPDLWFRVLSAPPRRVVRPVWRRPAVLVAAVSVLVLLIAAGAVGAVARSSAPPRPRMSPAGDFLARASHDSRASHDAAPGARPRGDQFVFEETRFWMPRRLDGTIVDAVVTSDRSWMSVDGTHDGLSVSQIPGSQPGSVPHRMVTPGCVGGREPMSAPPGAVDRTVTVPCSATAQAQGAFGVPVPTDVAAMTTYLYTVDNSGHTGGETPDEHAFAEAIVLLEEPLLPAAARAAVFGAMAGIPGLTLRPRATDATGRTGTGISQPQSWNHTISEVVLDSTTYRVLGTLTSEAVPRDGVLMATAVIRTGIVDRVGDLP